MARLSRLLMVLFTLSTLAACVLVPVAPRRVYCRPPAVVAPAAVFVRVS